MAQDINGEVCCHPLVNNDDRTSTLEDASRVAGCCELQAALINWQLTRQTCCAREAEMRLILAQTKPSQPCQKNPS